MEPFLLRMFQVQTKLQCEWVQFAAADIDAAIQQKNASKLFYALQNLLSAAANISKALWGQRNETEVAERRKPLRESIGVADGSPLREVRMRNNFEHIDNRLDEWWKNSKAHQHIDLSVVTKQFRTVVVAGPDPEYDWFRSIDLETGDLAFWGDEFNIKTLVGEVNRILPKLNEEVLKPLRGGAAPAPEV